MANSIIQVLIDSEQVDFDWQILNSYTIFRYWYINLFLILNKLNLIDWYLIATWYVISDMF